MENFNLILNQKVFLFVNYNTNFSRLYFQLVKGDCLLLQVLRVNIIIFSWNGIGIKRFNYLLILNSQPQYCFGYKKLLFCDSILVFCLFVPFSSRLMKLFYHFSQTFSANTFAIHRIDLECQVRRNIDIGAFARENIIRSTFKFISAAGAIFFHCITFWVDIYQQTV